MVFKDAKVFIQANINRRRLNHGLMKWLASNAASFDLGENVAITE
jgi:hypothetical protein